MKIESAPSEFKALEGAYYFPYGLAAYGAQHAKVCKKEWKNIAGMGWKSNRKTYFFHDDYCYGRNHGRTYW